MGKCNGLYSESFTCVSVCRKRLFMLYYVEHLCLKVTVCAYRPWVRDARIVSWQFHHYRDRLFLSQRSYDEYRNCIRRRSGTEGSARPAADGTGDYGRACGLQPDLPGRALPPGHPGRCCCRYPCHVADCKADAMGRGQTGKRYYSFMYRNRSCNRCGNICRGQTLSCGL